MVYRSKLPGRLLAAATLLFTLACSDRTAEPRLLVYGSPDAADRSMVSVLAEAAAERGLELRMTTDPAAVVEDSLEAYRGVLLLNTSADSLPRSSQIDLERFVEAGGGLLLIGAQPTRTWPWLQTYDSLEGADDGSMRLFRTAAGLESGDWSDAGFRERIAGALDLIASASPRYGNAITPRIPDSTRLVQQILVDGPLNEPTEMAVASDGRVFFCERPGNLKLYEPTSGEVRVVHEFDVFTEEENGLIGIALDPDFDENGWLYIARTVGDTLESAHRVSRFSYDGQGIGDERVLFDVPIDRGCCHTGGSMAFDPEGNLYVSFGDNTNPFATAYAPLDDRPGRELWDARRSSANTQDLRGKIVRIKPQPDGTYTIPEGNLFSDPEEGRPEIYTMGHRNPYRISIDPETRFLYWGDVGPDARIDSVAGPIGYDEVNQARSAGNFGWPLFIADNKAYADRDFATGAVGEPFDPQRPINHSRYNTGARVLPPAEAAMIYYPYERSEEFPLLGEGGRTAMAGPVYRTEAFTGSENRLPDYYDGRFIFYEWIRGWMMAATLNEEGDLVSMEPFLDHLTFDHPMDVELGPDGSLYVLEYGELWFAPNAGARLSRIVHNPGNRAPRAVITSAATSAAGAAPMEVELSAADSFDPDGDRLQYRWELPGGATASGATLQHTFTEAGRHAIRLIVSDRNGAADTATTEVVVGNAPPEVTIAVQGNRSFYWDAGAVEYSVEVMDDEDGALGSGIQPERVRVTLDQQQSAPLTAAPLGHQTEQAPAGLVFIQQSDCAACHGIDQASAGPSYRSVAERYAGVPGATQRLVRKVIEGGSGEWGEQVMPAHPDLSGAVAGEMVRYILSLATPGEALPASGSVSLAGSSGEMGGAYLLTASYVDQGGAGIEPLEGRDQVVLRAPTIAAADVTERWGMTSGAPVEGEATPVRIVADGGYLHLGSLDLTGVGDVRVRLQSVAGPVVLQLRSGGVDGEQLAEASVPVASQGVEASLSLTASGMHDLYLVARTDDPLVGPWSPAANILTLHFERANR